MNKISTYIFLFFSFQLSFVASSIAGLDSTAQIIKIYQNLQALPFDRTKIAAVENLAFQKDRAKFIFKKGTIYFSQPIAGKITGAVFLGEGSFELIPPNAIERQQVKRFVEKDSLNEQFSAAYLRFTDDTAEVLASQLVFHRGEIPKSVPRLHEKMDKLLLEDRGFNLSSRILGDLLNRSDEGLFFAAVEHPEPQLNFPSYFIFVFEPRASEEVAAFQYSPHSAEKSFYTLCSFHQLSDYSGDGSVVVADSDKEPLRISHYEIKLQLQKSGEIKAQVEFAYAPAVDHLRGVTFDLFHELKIDSVRNATGDSLEFIKEKKEGSFTVFFPEALPAQTQQKLRVFYSGKLLELAGDHVHVKDKLNWYPRSGYLLPATFDLTFEHSKSWEVVSVGKKIGEWESGGSAFSRWIEPVPSLAAAFAFGSYDSTTYKTEDGPPVKIYSTVRRSKAMREKIGAGVVNALNFFQERLGEVPYTPLTAVETPGRISQGYPGVLFLNAVIFAQDLERLRDAHLAHEVSHQWWGNTVGWLTYHDQWLSEGLAEYSGALVTQLVLKDDKTFFEILEGWRNDLLEKGHIGVSLGLWRFGFSKADLVRSQGLEAGPIWLGDRLGEKYPVDYYLIAYEKGAYVLHMLRILLRDFATDSDERFWQMLAEFVETYRGRRATTGDFKNIVENYAAQNMDWFFEQWVFGTDVPTYIYSQNIFELQGEYWLDLVVRQGGVSPNFKMFIPIGIRLDDKKTTQLIWMAGAQKAFRLGPFASMPQKIIFNDFAAVLARVKQK